MSFAVITSDVVIHLGFCFLFIRLLLMAEKVIFLFESIDKTSFEESKFHFVGFFIAMPNNCL
jgi:hypothetical protein